MNFLLISLLFTGCSGSVRYDACVSSLTPRALPRRPDRPSAEGVTGVVNVAVHRRLLLGHKVIHCSGVEQMRPTGIRSSDLVAPQRPLAKSHCRHGEVRQTDRLEVVHYSWPTPAGLGLSKLSIK